MKNFLKILIVAFIISLPIMAHAALAPSVRGPIIRPIPPMVPRVPVVIPLPAPTLVGINTSTSSPDGMGFVCINYEDNSYDEDGFIIEMSRNGYPFTQIDVIPALPGADGGCIYCTGGLPVRNLYTFRMFAFNAISISLPSNEMSATPL